jgi:hypothetical protein
MRSVCRLLARRATIPHGDHVGGDRSFVVGMSPFVTIIAIPGLAG